MNGFEDTRGLWIALGVGLLFFLALCGVVWLAGGCSSS